MNEKLQRLLKQAIYLLREIDDEVENELCLDSTCLTGGEEPTTEFTFWGIADMIEHYAERVHQ